MKSWGEGLRSFVAGRAFLWIAIALVAVRFSGATVLAGLAVGGLGSSPGVDTRALDEAFSVYVAAMTPVLILYLGALLASWPGRMALDLPLAATMALFLAVLVVWFVGVEPATRLVGSQWSALVLGALAASAVAAFGVAMGRRLDAVPIGGRARDGFLALWGGFAFAFLLSSLRLVDYAYLLGWSVPSGLLWLFDYGPSVVLSAIAIYFWAELCVRTAKDSRARVRAGLPPMLGLLVGLALSQGLGGFLLANTLAWGGAYMVFAPTSVSLSLVGFAVGSFVAIAWTVRRQMERGPWRFLFGGIAVAAMSGIVPFGGVLVSLPGILLGVGVTARGLAERRGGSESRGPSEDA